MEFRQIRYFIEIHRNGSFVRAAAALGLTQPALSRQIALLEREIGRRLFERTGRNVRLTPDGEKFLTRAVALYDLYRETLDFLEEDAEAPSGEYSISAGGTVAAHILPLALRRIREENPHVSFRVFEGDALETREALRCGDVDLGILTGPVEEGDLAQRYFLTDRIVPAVSGDHPLAHRRKIRIDDLRSREFVLYHPASAIRQVVEKRFRALRPVFKPRVAMELRSVESVLRSVEAGLGIGFVSLFALTPGLRALPIPELTAERKFYFCHRRGRSLNRLIGAIEAAIEPADRGD